LKDYIIRDTHRVQLIILEKGASTLLRFIGSTFFQKAVFSRVFLNERSINNDNWNKKWGNWRWFRQILAHISSFKVRRSNRLQNLSTCCSFIAFFFVDLLKDQIRKSKKKVSKKIVHEPWSRSTIKLREHVYWMSNWQYYSQNSVF